MTALPARLTSVRKILRHLQTLLGSTATPPVDRHTVRLQAVPICPNCGLDVHRVADGSSCGVWLHTETATEVCYLGRPAGGRTLVARPTYVTAEQRARLER